MVDAKVMALIAAVTFGMAPVLLKDRVPVRWDLSGMNPSSVASGRAAEKAR